MMVVSLPAKGKLSCDIFFTVTKGITIYGSYVGYVYKFPRISIDPFRLLTDDFSPSRTRQDAREALDIAARGKVKCYYQLKGLDALKE